MKFKSSIARAAMTALFIGASAQATIISTFSDLASWQAATAASPTTDNFNAAIGSNVGTAAGLNRNGINYQSFYNESLANFGTNGTYRSPGVGAGEQNLNGTGYMLAGPQAGDYTAPLNTGFLHGLRINLNALANIRSVGFDFSAVRYLDNGTAIFSTSALPITLNLVAYGGGGFTTSIGTATLTVPQTGTLVSGYFGFQTDADISGIKLYINATQTTNRILLDNFSIGEILAAPPVGGGGEIPEPSTYLLCAAGLLGAALIRRKTQ